MKLKNIKLYLLGDSICYGQLVNPFQTWVNILSRKLDVYFKKYNINILVQNAGVNGNTTRLALERINYDILSHKPEFALIQFGMNDCNYWQTDNGVPRVSKKAFVANLEEIVERILINQTLHCFINTNHISLKGKMPHTNKTHSESNEEYNELIREAVRNLKNNRVTLIDVEKYWKKYFLKYKNKKIQDFLLEDGIHLSKEGHNLYAKITIPIIKKTIEHYVTGGEI